MKKFIGIVLIVVSVMVLMTSCGASWEQTVKDFKSDYSGGLERNIKVYDSRTKEVVWSYSGKGYVDDNSKAGDFTIIYYENGVSKKADFLGDSLCLVSFEK